MRQGFLILFVLVFAGTVFGFVQEPSLRIILADENQTAFVGETFTLKVIVEKTDLNYSDFELIPNGDFESGTFSDFNGGKYQTGGSTLNLTPNNRLVHSIECPDGEYCAEAAQTNGGTFTIRWFFWSDTKFSHKDKVRFDVFAKNNADPLYKDLGLSVWGSADPVVGANCSTFSNCFPDYKLFYDIDGDPNPALQENNLYRDINFVIDRPSWDNNITLNFAGMPLKGTPQYYGNIYFDNIEVAKAFNTINYPQNANCSASFNNSPYKKMQFVGDGNYSTDFTTPIELGEYTYTMNCSHSGLTSTYNGTLAVVDPELELLKKYSPIIFLHPDEKYFPMTIDSLLNESDLYYYTLVDYMPPPLPVDEYSFLLNAGPLMEADLYGDDFPLHTFINMRFVSVSLAIPVFQIPFLSAPPKERFNQYPLRLYGRVKEQAGYEILQYWFFYPFDEWANMHEGDWELMQVKLDKSTETVVDLTYAQHIWGKTYLPNEITWFGTNPTVYVGKGSHASYQNTNPVKIGIFDEHISSEGLVLFENGVQFDTPNQKKNYSIIKVNDDTPWIGFPGRWGEVVVHPNVISELRRIIGFSGPQSPANQGKKWSNPLAWSQKPETSLIMSILHSPVDMHIYDSNGLHDGLDANGLYEIQIPETYIFVPEGQSEAFSIITSAQPLTYVLKSKGTGYFGFDIKKIDANTNTELTVSYNNVEIYLNTIATVSVTSENKPYKMQIDFDGDGTVDNTIYPGSYSCSGECEVTSLDSDEDGIPDSEDYCPETVGEQLVYGCSCEQILEIEPGLNSGQVKNGCSQGTISVFTKRIGWAKKGEN